MDGFEVLRSVRRKRALLKTLVISSYFDDYMLCRIERAGVQGFIDKSTNTVSELSLAITEIERGSTYFPRPYTEASRAHSRNPIAFDKVLTDREQTILSLVGEPLSDAEIAVQLKVSPETVEKHRFNIMRKLGLQSRAESARFARRCGLRLHPWPIAQDRPHNRKVWIADRPIPATKVRCKATRNQRC